MSNLFTDIGENIQAILNAKNISQTDLAQQIGVSKQVLNKIIRGKKAINIEEISKIAKALDMTIEALIKSKKANNESVLVMMGNVGNANTKDDLRFLNHIMDEMILLQELIQG